MGIQSLLPALAPITTKCSISEFAGQKIAIDGFVWLHKAAMTCASELYLNPRSEAILDYLKRHLQYVLDVGITPVIVFDGQPLPSKSITNQKRHAERKENLIKAQQLSQAGMTLEANQYYVKGIEIRPETVHTWIKNLQSCNIEYFVAPYEADAELAYLARSGCVSAVLTEDSDLIPYQCPLTLFKLDDQGNVNVVRFQDVISHFGVSILQFQVACALAGCDYIEHIRGIGIQKAFKIVKEHIPNNTPIDSDHLVTTFRNMIQALQRDYKFIKEPTSIPEDYDKQLTRAIMTFMFHRIYDPLSGSMQFLSPFHEQKLSMDFIGKSIPVDVLHNVVKGIIDPITFQKFEKEQTFLLKPCHLFDNTNKQTFDSSIKKNSIKTNSNRGLLTYYFSKNLKS